PGGRRPPGGDGGDHRIEGRPVPVESPARVPCAVEFDKAPFLVIWETTQACALSCRHCRASARPGRDPLELTTSEGRRLIRQTAEMGTPLLVLSGGDPVSRPDL